MTDERTKIFVEFAPKILSCRKPALLYRIDFSTVNSTLYNFLFIAIKCVCLNLHHSSTYISLIQQQNTSHLRNHHYGYSFKARLLWRVLKIWKRNFQCTYKRLNWIFDDIRHKSIYVIIGWQSLLTLKCLSFKSNIFSTVIQVFKVCLIHEWLLSLVSLFLRTPLYRVTATRR